MQFVTAFTRPKSTGTVFKKPSMTQQSSKDECDINSIIAKYRSTGIVSHVTGKRPLFGDFSAIGNFQDVQSKILLANESFAQLPSTVRKRFDNDPAEFIKFVQNPANLAEAEQLGLIQKPVKEDVKPLDSHAASAPSGAPLKAAAGDAPAKEGTVSS